jgi:hypothetical protein
MQTATVTAMQEALEMVLEADGDLDAIDFQQIRDVLDTIEAEKAGPVQMDQTDTQCFAVAGRIPFDDEDSVYCYNNCTRDEAEERFAKDIYNDADRDDEDHVAEENGTAVYINAVLTSKTPIQLVFLAD